MATCTDKQQQVVSASVRECVFRPRRKRRQWSLIYSVVSVRLRQVKKSIWPSYGRSFSHVFIILHHFFLMQTIRWSSRDLDRSQNNNVFCLCLCATPCVGPPWMWYSPLLLLAQFTYDTHDQVLFGVVHDTDSQAQRASRKR